MLSLKYINENIDKVKSSMSSKNIDYNLDDLLNLNLKRKKLINDDAIYESLVAFKRAGANAIVSYYADRIDKIIK